MQALIVGKENKKLSSDLNSIGFKINILTSTIKTEYNLEPPFYSLNDLNLKEIGLVINNSCGL